MPYKRYVFIVHCYAGGGGGTEHLNSTVMQAAPSRFDTAESYRGFLGLASHEMFHTWNVKQLRPADLKPYDYQREQYSRLLWVVEGTTSYYDDLTLVRTGHMKPDDYLKNLGEAIDAARRRPGSGIQSLEDSSFDSWIKYNRPSPDSVNSTVSFYDKGAQASLVLDMEIRRASGGKASLDNAMQSMYRGYPLSGPGYTSDNVLAAVSAAAGADLTDSFTRAVRSTEALDFERALEVVGLEVTLKPAKKDGADEKAAESEGGDAPKEKSYLGFTVTDQAGIASVSAVLADGPAYSAGLLAGDQIVAVNGERFRASDLDGLLKRLKPGDAARVSFFRYDALRELELRAAAVPDGKWTVSRTKEPAAEQRAAYEAWLGQKWPEKKKAESEPKDGP
jgi:predicted metalloprotease with PDZ domain